MAVREVDTRHSKTGIPCAYRTSDGTPPGSICLYRMYPRLVVEPGEILF
jgi:hypothetical protein